MPRTVIWARSEVQYAASRQSHILGYFADPTIQKFGELIISTLLRMEMVEDSVLHKCGLQRIL